MTKRKDSTSDLQKVKESPIGSYLRDVRERKGITLISVAERLAYSKGYVSSIETGKRPFPNDLKQKWGEILGLSLEEVNALTQYSSTDTVDYWNVPYEQDSLFTGREDDIQRIHDSLNSLNTPSYCSIIGISGIGKTALAVEYAFRYRSEYQYVLWVEADTPETLSANFAGLADILNLPESDALDSKAPIAIVKRWVDRNSRCLLIFDNVDAESMQADFLSQLGKNHFILTTRTHLPGLSTQVVELVELKEDDSVLLLLHKSGQVPAKTKPENIPDNLKIPAQQIVAVLGGLPFALNQAAAYINEAECGLPFYLKLLQKEQKKVLEEGSDAPHATFMAWNVTIQKIRESDPQVAELLHLCAFLHPDKISKEMLLDGAAALPPNLRDIASDLPALSQAIKALRQYALVWVNETTGAFYLHRLIQATIRESLPLEQQRQYAEYVVSVLSLAFPLPDIAKWNITWSKCQLYSQQARSCVALIEQWKIANDASRQLLHNLGQYLEERTEFKNARRLYLLALEVDKQSQQEHDAIVEDLHKLALFYERREKYETAAEYYKQAMVRSNAEDNLDSYKDLVTGYISLLKRHNRIEEAREIQTMISMDVTESDIDQEDDKKSARRVAVNDTNKDIKYDGEWTYNQRRWGDYDHDAHIISQRDASFKYTFTGYGIEIISDPSSFQWEVDVFIDGEHMQSVRSSLFEDLETQTIIFSEIGLDQDKHEIEVKLVSGTFALDALGVFTL